MEQHGSKTFIGKKILSWYAQNARQLPWRENPTPYTVWICEIILQQTQVKQGLNHYLNFVERFPDVHALAAAPNDDVLHAWKGLGYYSRALNLHKAAEQIVTQFGGVFPDNYNGLLTLKGVGKYTAAAIASISFGERIPAVDGNFYRVLSRLFADGFDVSQPAAFRHFSELAMQIMPEENPGDFNQAIMDIGSEICKPKNPVCGACPVNADCIAYGTGTIGHFPVKTKKVKPTELALEYFFVEDGGRFLVRRRGDDFIWKRLYEFPSEIPAEFNRNIISSKIIRHKLTHRSLEITIHHVSLNSLTELQKFAVENQFIISDKAEAEKISFPKPLQNYLEALFDKE